MRIFMSYASEQKADAEAVAFSLRSRGHMVFFDRDDLPEGTSYDDRIAAAIDRSDLMIFLISPAAIAEGRYTLTELRFARYKWRHPGGRVLPVMMEVTPLPAVPSYLRAVSILEPQGNKAAEVAFAVERLRGIERAVNLAGITAAAGVLLAFICGLMPVSLADNSWVPLRGVLNESVAMENGLLLAAFLGGLYWWLGNRKWWAISVVALSAVVGWVFCLYVFVDLGGTIKFFQDVPVGHFDSIVGALPPEKRTELSESSDRVQAYLRTGSRIAERGSAALVLALCGLACFLPILGGMATIEPALRSLHRVVLGALCATLTGAAGYLLAEGSGIKIESDKVFWFVEEADVWFALLYLPWLAVIPAAIAYWLVRGQDQ
jgi:hypothetical protein